MARLMVVPIQDRGDAVLILTRCADIELIGFIARTALRGFFRHDPSMCDCMSFVTDNLPSIERALLRKSLQAESRDGPMPCIEMTATDLAEGA